tara:strand:- start:1 stop:1794 length:1794 start_codon:yes stop_codon:yes gene_type:complete
MSWRSGSFFGRLVGGLTLIVALTTVVGGVFVLSDVDDALNEQLVDALDAQAILLMSHARDNFVHGNFDTTDGRSVEADMALVTEAHGFRVTFIRRDGVVVLDTNKDTDSIENHLDRNEVQEALVQGRGTDVRRSRTIDDDSIYVARVQDPKSEKHGIVRVSAPSKQIRERVMGVQLDVLMGAGLAALLAMLLGLWLARKVATPIAEMTNVAEDLRAGRFEARIQEVGTGEVGVLGDALNRLGAELSAKIETLSADEAQLRAMLAGMVEGVVAVDPEDGIVFTNRAAREFLGLSKDGPKPGTKIWELVRVPGMDELVGAARSADDAASGEFELVGGASGRTVLAKAHRYTAHGQISVVVVLEDVTELRRLETVRRDFVANVSHELKTPLTSIRGFVETLLGGAIDEPEHNRRFLEKVNDNVRRLGSLVTDLLSLARIEAHEGSLPLARMNWQRITDACLRRCEAHAKRRNIEIVAQIAKDDVSVMGDEEALTQVVDNLVDNALKYTPEGGTVNVTLGLVGGDQVVLEVRDTGIGIPSEDRERVFERFYRVDKARSREMGGTGLGLAIVKHLVGAMHGRIELESETGAGSTFRVMLDRA